MLIEVREEMPGDHAAIREINQRAFARDQEANIVDALMANGAVRLSLVATVNGRFLTARSSCCCSTGPECAGPPVWPGTVTSSPASGSRPAIRCRCDGAAAAWAQTLSSNLGSHPGLKPWARRTQSAVIFTH